MALLNLGDGVEDRPDTLLGRVGVAPDVEDHERGAAVARDLARVAPVQRRLEVGDRPKARERARDVGDAGPEGRIPDRERAAAALDEDLLGRAVGEAGGGEALVGPA